MVNRHSIDKGGAVGGPTWTRGPRSTTQQGHKPTFIGASSEGPARHVFLVLIHLTGLCARLGPNTHRSNQGRSGAEEREEEEEEEEGRMEERR